MAEHKSVRRLAGPFLLLLIFLGLAVFSGELLGELGQEAISRTRAILSYLVQIGVWLASAWLLNRLLHVFFWEMVVERATGRPVPRLVKDLVAAVIFLVAVTGIVGIVFEQSVTGIWATSGAIGLVIGIALQSMILDVFSGLAMNVDRAFRIGDWIMIHQRSPEVHIIGCIQEINWRTTRLKTTDNNLVVVPNSVMGTSILTNFMAPEPVSRLELHFTLDFSVPSDRAIRVLEGAVRAILKPGGVLPDPEPSVRITGVSELGIVYRVRYWIVPRDLSPAKARHVVISSVMEHLKQAGLSLAYPKHDVFTSDMPQRQLDSSSHDDMERLLARIELFSHLADDERRRLAEGLVRRQFGPGETLIERGAEGQSMFVLVEGLVYVHADVRGDGTEVQVAQIVPGQFFGEMSLLTGERRSATVRAVTSAVAYEITKASMTELFQSRPALAETISAVVAERKLRNERAGSPGADHELTKKQSTVASEILGKIRHFFRGVF